MERVVFILLIVQKYAAINIGVTIKTSTFYIKMKDTFAHKALIENHSWKSLSSVPNRCRDAVDVHIVASNYTTVQTINVFLHLKLLFSTLNQITNITKWRQSYLTVRYVSSETKRAYFKQYLCCKHLINDIKRHKITSWCIYSKTENFCSEKCFNLRKQYKKYHFNNHMVFKSGESVNKKPCKQSQSEKT